MSIEQIVGDYLTQGRCCDEAAAYIMAAGASASRVVGRGGQSNTVIHFVSSKMGFSIQAESSTAEMAVVAQLERSQSVIAYFDQPPPVLIHATTKKGTKRWRPYTADFLVCEREGPVVYEVKPKRIVDELVSATDPDWERTETGVRYRPAADAFAALGIRHIVWSVGPESAVLAQNYLLLLRARSVIEADCDGLVTRVAELLTQSAFLTLHELAELLELTDLTPLLCLVDSGGLCARLETELLSQPRSAYVSLSEKMLSLAPLSEGVCGVSSAGLVNSVSVPMAGVPSVKQANAAFQRLARMEGSTYWKAARSWRKRIAEAREKGISAFTACLGTRFQSGNRNAKRISLVFEFLDRYIREKYSSTRRLQICGAHKEYKYLARKAHPGHEPVSRTTFSQRLRRHCPADIAKGRGGRRAANAGRAPTDAASREPRPLRVLQRVAIDHYRSDQHCEVLVSNGISFKARPWITLMLDLASGKILAVWLSLLPPSRRACAMLIRLCVRHHGKLPEQIIVDCGAEFRSVYFRSLLASYGIALVERDAENPRKGGEIERTFCSFMTDWLQFRKGNTVEKHDRRAISSSHSADKFGLSRPEVLYAELLRYVGWRNDTVSGVKDASPNVTFERGLARFRCSGIECKEDAAFLIATAVDGGKYSVDPSRGIQVGKLHYWHEALSTVAGRKNRVTKKVEVRRDPENPFCIYALVGNSWIVCAATGMPNFSSMHALDRFAVATSILECESFREQAREEAEQRLFASMEELDKSEEMKRIADNLDAAVTEDLDEEYEEEALDAGVTGQGLGFDPLPVTRKSEVQS